MFESGANIPYFQPNYKYYSDFKKIDYNTKLNQQISGKSYNTKVTFYPDQTINICIAKSDIFGFQSACINTNKNDFSDILWNDRCEELKKLHYQNLKVRDIISTSFDSVNDYLLFKHQEREQYKNTLPCLDDCEVEFLNSLRSSLRTDSLKRTKDSIFDFVMSNEWSYFFTGTFDPKKIDSFSPDMIKKPLRNWLNHLVDRYGIQYIIIFEHHKKGGIHIHGLIKENPEKPLKLVESGTRSYFGFKKPMKDSTAIKHGLNVDSGKIVYNLKTWRFGWSTAIKVYGSQPALARYVTKYITKSNQKIMGRYFWHSRNLHKPNVFYIDTDYNELQLPTYHGFKYIYQASESEEPYQEYTDILYDDKICQDKISEDNFMQGWVDL